jgi:hypothetical protein
LRSFFAFGLLLSVHNLSTNCQAIPTIFVIY